MKGTGDWLLSNLVASVFNYGAAQSSGGADNNLNFGDSNDHLISGSPTVELHFCFRSHLIGAFETASFTAALHAGPALLDVIDLSLTTDDVTLREVRAVPTTVSRRWPRRRW